MNKYFWYYQQMNCSSTFQTKIIKYSIGILFVKSKFMIITVSAKSIIFVSSLSLQRHCQFINNVAFKFFGSLSCKNLLTFLRLVLYIYININKQAHASRSRVPCSIFIFLFLFIFIIVTDKHSYLTGA